MNRRDFLKGILAGAAVGAVAPAMLVQSVAPQRQSAYRLYEQHLEALAQYDKELRDMYMRQALLERYERGLI